MRLYKVCYTWGLLGDASAGFKFFSSRSKAEQSARAWRAEVIPRRNSMSYGDEGDADDEIPAENEADVEVITVSPSKRGMLDALNFHAGHPDNG